MTATLPQESIKNIQLSCAPVNPRNNLLPRWKYWKGIWNEKPPICTYSTRGRHNTVVFTDEALWSWILSSVLLWWLHMTPYYVLSSPGPDSSLYLIDIPFPFIHFVNKGMPWLGQFKYFIFFQNFLLRRSGPQIPMCENFRDPWWAALKKKWVMNNECLFVRTLFSRQLKLLLFMAKVFWEKYSQTTFQSVWEAAEIAKHLERFNTTMHTHDGC